MGDLPAWFNEKTRRRKQNRDSKRQEEDRAREVGGRPQPGSGSSWRAPGDVVNGEYLEEMKFTDAASFVLRLEDLLLIENKAIRVGKSGRMLVEFRAHGRRYRIEEE